MSKQLACSADACLNLIDNNENIVVVAILNKFFYIFGIEDIYTALALNEFKHYCAGFVRNNCFQSVHIVCVCILKALCKREEIVMKNILTCCGKSCNSSAVKGIVKRYDFISALAVLVKAVLTGNFDCTFVSLCTAVAKADL